MLFAFRDPKPMKSLSHIQQSSDITNQNSKPMHTITLMTIKKSSICDSFAVIELVGSCTLGVYAVEAAADSANNPDTAFEFVAAKSS
jgi:hypothetical protein